MEHYRSTAIGDADKRLLAALLDELNASRSALRLDACRAWVIRGTRGFITTYGDGSSYQLMLCHGQGPQKWTYEKKALHFCEVTQDGENEGVLRLRHMPTTEQARIIRATLGIRVRVVLAGERLVNALASLEQARQARDLEG